MIPGAGDPETSFEEAPAFLFDWIFRDHFHIEKEATHLGGLSSAGQLSRGFCIRVRNGWLTAFSEAATFRDVGWPLALLERVCRGDLRGEGFRTAVLRFFSG